MTLLPIDQQSARPQMAWWVRLTFLFALGLSVTLTFLTLLVYLPQILPIAHGPRPIFARDLMLLALAGCAVLTTTTHLLRDRLSEDDRTIAVLVAAAGMLIMPCALAIHILA